MNDSFFAKLEENIELFAISNENGDTIYDRYLSENIPLKEIENSHIKKLVTQHHWAQIWDGVIRMSDFFNAYFSGDDDMDNIKFTLGHYAQLIKKLLNELGYTIDRIKPLAQLSSDYWKGRDSKEIDKSYIEGFVLRNLVEDNNENLRRAVAASQLDYDHVIFVERLGLTDKLEEKPVEISNLRLGTFDKGTLQAYFSSVGRSID
jgi:hypothetical protein